MLTQQFKQDVFIGPLQAGFDELTVVSGYATGATALQHLTGGGDSDKEAHFDSDRKLNIVLGMYSMDGVPRSDHDLFCRLSDQYENFSCRYYDHLPAIHSKVYLWSKKGIPELAFVGSANYSLSAMRGVTSECLTDADSDDALRYCQEIWHLATPCKEIVDLKTRSEFRSISVVDLRQGIPANVLEGCPYVDLPLTSRGLGLEVPLRAQLNWGQRPDENREPNQAYISVPSVIQRQGFFPERGEFFTVLTDDGRTFDMSRNQDSGKGLHTPNNSDIGRYFRQRLGVVDGAMVDIGHLNRYGRLTVRFYYLGEDKYYLDFSRE